jgi:hypothetical protein
MFRKSYYNTQLLPAVLVSRPACEEEARAKQSLIDLLNSKGRIPPSLFRMYASGELGKPNACYFAFFCFFSCLKLSKNFGSYFNTGNEKQICNTLPF